MRATFFAVQRTLVTSAACYLVLSASIFRRRPKATRADAFQQLFDTLASVYIAAGDLKPEWQARWQARSEGALPPRFDGLDDMARNAAHDMRFAAALLQQHRWKSVVQPLFETAGVADWQRFSASIGNLPIQLVETIEQHRDLLLDDEIDWIGSAIEQLDEQARRNRQRAEEGAPLYQLIAEGVYAPVYSAIQLSERLIERLRFEAAQSARQRR